MRPIVDIYRLGRTSYTKTLNIQNVLFDNLKRIVTSSGDYSNTRIYDEARRGGIIIEAIQSIIRSGPKIEPASHLSLNRTDLPVTNSLILVEHEPVYTVGLRAQSYNQDYVAKLRAKLAESHLKADFVHTNRGGLITFHGPGQLVAYPIIYLGDFPKTIPNKSVKAYVKRLENTIIETLARVGIDGAHTVREFPGVWLSRGERKVAFVGIACKRYVTMHGVSINCDCDLFWFDHIVSCGIENKLITSVKHELASSEQIVGGNFTPDEGRFVSSIRDDISSLPEDNLAHTNIKKSPTRASGNRGPRYSVQNIANAFCLSFSHHFDCELLER